MSKQKPVWRTGNGFGVCEASGEVLLKYGQVIAYQTTRTKAAKCESVECNKCRGGGLLFFRKSSHSFAITVNNDSQWSEQCRSCKGKGYRWEAIK